MRISIRSLATAALLAIVIMGSSRSASAQLPLPGQGNVPNTGPAVSPYLNLLRRGTSPGVNYYGIVKPQLDMQNALRGLQGQLNAQQTTQVIDPQTGLPVTGHPTMFLNTGGYFLSGGRGLGATTLGQRPPGVGQGLGQQGQAPTRGSPAGRTAGPQIPTIPRY